MIANNQHNVKHTVSSIGSTHHPLQTRLEGIHEILEDLTSSPSSHDMMELAMATVTSLDISQDG